MGSYYCAKQEAENDIQLIPEDLKTPVVCSPGYQGDVDGRCVGKLEKEHFKSKVFMSNGHKWFTIYCCRHR